MPVCQSKVKPFILIKFIALRLGCLLGQRVPSGLAKLQMTGILHYIVRRTAA